MFEGLLSIVLGEHMAGKLFRPPVGSAGYQRSLTPNRRLYKTTDGYICVLIHTDKHWRKFFEAIGRQDLFQTDQRFSPRGHRAAKIDAVYAILSEILATRGRDEWLTVFETADIPASRMYCIDDIMHDDHLKAIGYFSDSPASQRRHDHLACRANGVVGVCPRSWSSCAATWRAHRAR